MTKAEQAASMPFKLRLRKRLKQWVHNMISLRVPGDMGFFLKRYPITTRYYFENWGGRLYEYYWVEKILKDIGIAGKNVVDIGIGPPTDSDFYKFYLRSGCRLTGVDPDPRLPEKTVLSGNCVIYKRSAENMDFITDCSVDVIVSISVMEHMPLRVFENVMREIRRIVKDDSHLVLTFDYTISKAPAYWAILERTWNGLPETRNDPAPDGGGYRQVTPGFFCQMISPHFVTQYPVMHNEKAPLEQIVHSLKYNSRVGYLHLKKSSGGVMA